MPRLHRSPVWSDPRVKPPFGSVEIDWTQPLAAAMHSVFLFNELAGPARSLASPSLSGTSTNLAHVYWAMDRTGPGMFFDNSSGTSLSLTAAPTPWAIAPPFSLLTWWNWQSGDKQGFAGPFQNRGASQNGFACVDDQGSGDRFQPHLYTWNGSSETAHYKGSLRLRPFNNKFLWAHDGTTASLYVDGVTDNATTSTVSGYGGGSASINIGSGYNTITGQITLVAVWRRALTAAEALQLAAEPYALLQPVIRRRYFVPASGAPSSTTKTLTGALMLQGVGA